MSLEVTTRIWNSSLLKTGDKLLLLAIGEMADHDGFCWPGVAKLAEMTGQSKRQLPRTMNNLRKSGEVIIWDQQGQRGGRGYTNIYLVTVGLTEEQIREIIERRFALMPDEIDSVLIQEGVIYDTLCEQKRVTPTALLRTRKTATYDTQNEKRVTDLAQKGDISDRRTVINQNPKDNIITIMSETENSHLPPDTPFGSACKYWETNIGTLNPVISDNIRTYVFKCPEGWVEKAIREGVENGVRKWNYIQAILDSWLEAGQITDKPVQKGQHNGQRKQRSNSQSNPARATGPTLDELPSVNIYTDEIIPPPGSG